MNCFQIDFGVRPSTKTMFGGSHQQPDATLQHSTHDQIQNHATLSNSQDCTLQLHWVCVACFDVQ